MRFLALTLLLLVGPLNARQVLLQDPSPELKRILSENGVEVIDSFSMENAVLMIHGNACIFKPVEGLEKFLESQDIPFLFPLREDATADSRDFVWIDRSTLAVGIGWHTNLAAFNQLENALDLSEIELVPVFLPYGKGESAAPYLQSLFSIVDDKVLVIYHDPLPHVFVEYIQNCGFQLIPISETEFKHQGANILTVTPGVCLMLEGCAELRTKLEELGIQVDSYSHSQRKGPTSLALPF